MRFSDVVLEARAQGYTEPDPREDLSGMDVARKVIILARECGLQVRGRGARLLTNLACQLIIRSIGLRGGWGVGR